MNHQRQQIAAAGRGDTLRQQSLTPMVWAWLLVTISFAGAAAAQPGAVGTWTSLETAHFTFFTNTPLNVARSTAYDLEEMRSVLLQLWPTIDLDAPMPTFIYLFEDDETFRPFRLHGQASLAPDQPMALDQAAVSAGYLVPHEHGTYAALVLASETRPMRYVYKQYIHQYLHQKFPTLPLWLRYGLAEYYSTFEVDDGAALLGKPIKAHRDQVIFQQGATGFSGILALESIPSEPQAAAGFFARAWTLVHYFQSDPERGRQLKKFAQLVVVDEIAAAEAFQQAFEVDIATLEKRIGAYISQSSFNYYRLPVDRGAHPAKVFGLPEHEVLYRLGDLLARGHRERGPEAAEYFRRAVALAPRHGASWAGLGYLAEQEGDREAALKHYEKAMESAGDDFLVPYLYGSNLARSLNGRRPAHEEEEAFLARAIAALGNAVERKPTFAPAWAELGYARNLEAKASPQAAADLERALKLLPARLDVAFNLLLAHARLGDRESAGASVDRMRWLGADPATLGRAREVLLRMDYQVAAGKVRSGHLDDAIALFAQIEGESQDPALRDLVVAQLEKLESTAQHLSFIEDYRKVALLLSENKLEAASMALEELSKMAQPGSQREVVEKFYRTLEKLKNQ